MKTLNNSQLFKQAHKLTKQTIQPNETYRYKFGQWLIFLKAGVTNILGITNINQNVCYVPMLEHDRISFEYSYNKDINTMLDLFKFICTNNYSLFIMLSFIIYRII